MRNRYKLLLVILLSMVNAARISAVSYDEIQFNSSDRDVDKIEYNSLFEINRHSLEDNPCLRQIGCFADSLLREGRLRRFEICGYASPDGPRKANSKLALDRAKAVQSYFHNEFQIPDSLFDIYSVDEDWDKTRELIDSSSMISRDGLLLIIDGTVDSSLKETRLKRYEDGKAWRLLARDVFPSVRRAEIVLSYDNGELQTTVSDNSVTLEVLSPDIEPEITLVPETEATDTISVQDMSDWQRHAYLKTNIPAWFLIWLNASGEYDIAPHWSANLSIYYSGFDYFHHRRKYRTFAIMPEIRYWFFKNNQGFFVAPHFGLAWYNVSFDGPYRYQDHDGSTPALGGGVNVGFRFNISRNKRWRMEFSIGFGIYHLDYDLFINEHNGLLAGRRRRTFYGIDNAALSICYMFDIRKKGAKK